MKLVAYFSASGITKSFAEQLSKKIGSDLYEIKPEVLYTNDDLNWSNPQSRSSIEMKDNTNRVDFIDKLDNIDKYEEVFIGFPVWWYTCPHIVNSFLEYYDLTNKKVKVFFTSGSTGEDTIKKSLSNYSFISSVNRIQNENDLDKLL